jgi:hypothetical protein
MRSYDYRQISQLAHAIIASSLDNFAINWCWALLCDYPQNPQLASDRVLQKKKKKISIICDNRGFPRRFDYHDISQLASR